MRLSLRTAVTGALLALATVRAGAQENPNATPSVAPFSNVFLSLGNAFTNVNALNVRFDSTHYDAIAGHGFSIGGGGYVSFGRALFGGEYHDADFGFESDRKSTRLNSSHI